MGSQFVSAMRPTPKSAGFFKGQIFSFLGAAVVLTAAVAGIAAFAIQQQDALALRHQKKILNSVLAIQSRNLSGTIAEYSWWDEAVVNLTLKLDPEWADANIGAYLHENSGIAATFVLDGKNKTVYSMSAGERVVLDAVEYLGPDLLKLANMTRGTPPDAPVGADGYVNTESGVFRVGAMVLTPYTDPNLIPTELPRSVLILAQKVDNELLDAISRDFEFPKLELLRRPGNSDHPTVTLSGFDGADVANLAWSPSLPGRQLLEAIFPAMSGVVIAWILLAAWFIGRTRSGMAYVTSKNIDLSQKTTELEAAVEVARLASQVKSNFLSRVSHEFRTPLNSIIGFSQIISMDENNLLSNDDKENLSQIEMSGKHLAKLVDDVLELSRIDQGDAKFHMELVDPRPIVDDVVRSAIEQLPRSSLSIRDLTTETELPTLQLDRARLGQALRILVSNAIAYGEGKTAAVIVSCQADPRTLRFSITNTGPGIESAVLHKIFDPFAVLNDDDFQASKSGLSLIIVKQLVEYMDGRMGVDSSAKIGTTLWIEFPIATPS